MTTAAPSAASPLAIPAPMPFDADSWFENWRRNGLKRGVTMISAQLDDADTVLDAAALRASTRRCVQRSIALGRPWRIHSSSLVALARALIVCKSADLAPICSVRA
jgi:hypothetical protein